MCRCPLWSADGEEPPRDGDRRRYADCRPVTNAGGGGLVALQNPAAAPRWHQALPSPSQSRQVPSSLVAAFGFEEGANSGAADSSGRESLRGRFQGSLDHGPASTGRSARLDGINDLVTVTDAAALDLTTGMTMETWVPPTSLASWRTVVLKETLGCVVILSFRNNNTCARQDMSGEPATSQSPVRRLCLSTRRTHLAVTQRRVDAAIVRQRCPGDHAFIADWAIVASNNPLRIGGNTFGAAAFAKFAIDEVDLQPGAQPQVRFKAT